MNELAESKNAYSESLDKLRRDYRGSHYAVFAGAAFLGAYPTYHDALLQGYNTVGDKPFLVKQIDCDEEKQCVASPVPVTV